MSIQRRLNDEQAALLSHPIVQSVAVVKYTQSRLDGYIRLRSTLINGDFLEIALHVQLQPENGETVIDSYRYQWMDGSRSKLRRRWYNTPHFPKLAGFPHHCHVEDESIVEPAQPMDVNMLLETVAGLLGE